MTLWLLPYRLTIRVIQTNSSQYISSIPSQGSCVTKYEDINQDLLPKITLIFYQRDCSSSEAQSIGNMARNHTTFL
jgi:hypothetical protein